MCSTLALLFLHILLSSALPSPSGSSPTPFNLQRSCTPTIVKPVAYYHIYSERGHRDDSSKVAAFDVSAINQGGNITFKHDLIASFHDITCPLALYNIMFDLEPGLQFSSEGNTLINVSPISGQLPYKVVDGVKTADPTWNNIAGQTGTVVGAIDFPVVGRNGVNADEGFFIGQAACKRYTNLRFTIDTQGNSETGIVKYEPSTAGGGLYLYYSCPA